MTALLEAKDVSAGYPQTRGAERRVLERVSLRCEAGRVRVLLGPNGAGKSTLVRALLGLHPMMSGQVLIDGKDAALLSRRERARTLAWVPQQFEAQSGFSVKNTVLMGRTPHLGLFGLPSRADLEHATRLLSELGLGELLERRVESLSGGEQRRVLLARALIQAPKVLLLDEPTAFLDLHHQVELLRRLRALAESGLAIFAVLHDVNLAAAYADDVTLLKDGRVIAEGPAKETLTVDRLSLLYSLPMRMAEAGGAPLFAPAL